MSKNKKQRVVVGQRLPYPRALSWIPLADTENYIWHENFVNRCRVTLPNAHNLPDTGFVYTVVDARYERLLVRVDEQNIKHTYTTDLIDAIQRGKLSINVHTLFGGDLLSDLHRSKFMEAVLRPANSRRKMRLANIQKWLDSSFFTDTVVEFCDNTGSVARIAKIAK